MKPYPMSPVMKTNMESLQVMIMEATLLIQMEEILLNQLQNHKKETSIQCTPYTELSQTGHPSETIPTQEDKTPQS